MKTAPSTRSGCSAASSRPALPAEREPDDDARSVSVASITASASAANSRSSYAAGVCGPVGAAVAAPVERDHAAVAREVGDLHLPVARVDDRPGRQEQDRRLARRRRPRSRAARRRARRSRTRPGSAPGSARRARCGQLDSHRSIQSRSSACPVSTPPRRSTMTRWLKVMTSETSASSGMSIPSSRWGSANASVSTARHSAFTRARRSRSFGSVPGERLQLEPDLLVGEVLAHEVAHRRPPLLDERHRRPRTARAGARSGAR